MTLKEQRIIVLGGTSGIGFAVASGAAREGASVVVGSSSPAKVASAVESLGAGAAGRAVDLLNEDAVRAFFAWAGAYDHLAYTSGDPLQPRGWTPIRPK